MVMDESQVLIYDNQERYVALVIYLVFMMVCGEYVAYLPSEDDFATRGRGYLVISR